VTYSSRSNATGSTSAQVNSSLKLAHVFLFTVCFSAVMFLLGATVSAQGKQEATESKEDGSTAVLIREPPTPEKCTKQQGALINMLVLGDSIMWGQGLKEENKISFRVQDWLCEQTGRRIKVWREAHSGSVLMDEPTTKLQKSETNIEAYAVKGNLEQTQLQKVSNRIDRPTQLIEPNAANQSNDERHGEVNVGNPTIARQVENALKRFKGPEVDFILMNGCINDFDFQNFIDTSMTIDQIDARTEKVCYERMTPILETVAERFPNSRIIVPGYYPVVTEKSAKNVLYRFAFGWLFSRQKQKWFFPNAKKQLFQKLTVRSNQWAESSNDALRRSVAKANQKAANRIVFAPITYGSKTGFGSRGSGFAAPKKTSLLWTSRLNSTGRGAISKFFYVVFVLNYRALRPNDEVSSDRKNACKQAGLGFKCQYAAWGHPNTKGVGEYVESITRELRRLMETSGWLRDGPLLPVAATERVLTRTGEENQE
jgi:hypothetical protein